MKKYGDALEKMRIEKGVGAEFQSELLSLDPVKRVADFKTPKGQVSRSFDLIHVTPPMSAPDFLKNSPLANAAGYVDVDKDTLQHVKYPNVFAIGDCSSLPTSKTAAAITKQAPVLVHNLLQQMKGGVLNAKYDGYTSCPILVGDKKLILAEFLYGGVPKESFPMDQSVPSTLGYYMKKDVFPFVYWQWFIKGQWYGNSAFFKPKFD